MKDYELWQVQVRAGKARERKPQESKSHRIERNLPFDDD